MSESIPSTTSPQPRLDALRRSFAELQRRYESRAPSGRATGLDGLDAWTGGLESDDLMIIGGRTSLVRSMLCLNIALHAAMSAAQNAERPSVLVCTTKSSGSDVMTQAISILGGVRRAALRTGRISDDDWPKISAAIGWLKESGFNVEDAPEQTLRSLRSRIREFAAAGPVALIAVDPIQKIGHHRWRWSRAEQLGEISGALKALARELATPIIATSAFNRATYAHSEPSPCLADLHGAGAIGDDADIVVLLDERGHSTVAEKSMTRVDAIIAKNRDGPTGTLPIEFDLATLRTMSPRVDFE